MALCCILDELRRADIMWTHSLCSVKKEHDQAGRLEEFVHLWLRALLLGRQPPVLGHVPQPVCLVADQHVQRRLRSLDEGAEVCEALTELCLGVSDILLDGGVEGPRSARVLHRSPGAFEVGSQLKPDCALARACAAGDQEERALGAGDECLTARAVQNQFRRLEHIVGHLLLPVPQREDGVLPVRVDHGVEERSIPEVHSAQDVFGGRVIGSGSEVRLQVPEQSGPSVPGVRTGARSRGGVDPEQGPDGVVRGVVEIREPAAFELQPVQRPGGTGEQCVILTELKGRVCYGIFDSRYVHEVSCRGLHPRHRGPLLQLDELYGELAFHGMSAHENHVDLAQSLRAFRRVHRRRTLDDHLDIAAFGGNQVLGERDKTFSPCCAFTVRGLAPCEVHPPGGQVRHQATSFVQGKQVLCCQSQQEHGHEDDPPEHE